MVPALCHLPTLSPVSGSWDPSQRSEIQAPGLGIHAAPGPVAGLPCRGGSRGSWEAGGLQAGQPVLPTEGNLGGSTGIFCSSKIWADKGGAETEHADTV